MRNWNLWKKALVGVAAISMVGACEEMDPGESRKPAPVVSTQVPTVTAPVVKAPEPVKVAEPSQKPIDESQPPTPSDDSVGNKKVDELLSGARTALTDGDFDRATKLAHAAQLKAPHRAGVYNVLGRIALKKGARKDAIAQFEKAIEENPRSSYAHNNLGLALIYDGRFDDAADELEEATELEPVEGYMWNNLGMAYEHLDRLDDARDAYRKAAELENGRSGDNLARLVGVKSVRTAKADTLKAAPDDVDLPAVGELPDGGTH